MKLIKLYKINLIFKTKITRKIQEQSKNLMVIKYIIINKLNVMKQIKINLEKQYVTIQVATLKKQL